MRYTNVKRGRFIERPNRFIALVESDGKEEVCHVKNTGRCRELLVPGADVILQESENPARKTRYDLIAVYKGDMLVNIDSQAPNRVAEDYLRRLFPDIKSIHSEVRYLNSRLDFYIETEKDRIFAEVKGVTLEEDGVAMFPDAPTERGVRHIEELCRWAKEGNTAVALFVIQMRPVKYFTPNDRTHKAFGDALRRAEKSGVIVHAVDCLVTEDGIEAGTPVEVRLQP
jgi:sugar fermentation stimulation protein A